MQIGFQGDALQDWKGLINRRDLISRQGYGLDKKLLASRPGQLLQDEVQICKLDPGAPRFAPSSQKRSMTFLQESPRMS